jgi:plastocyanin
MGISRKTVFLQAALAIAAALAMVPLSLSARAGGTIVGTISTKETARAALRATIDPTVCGSTLPDESVVVDAAGRLANAVVTVAGVKTAAPAEAVVANEKCRFVPHVALIRPAGTVKVTNKDPAPVLHTTHAQMTDGKFLFNVSLPIPNMTISKPVDKAGILQLVCNTHTWMRGWLVVTEELSVASGVDGKFRIEGVPAGTQELRIWHEALKAAPLKVTVKDGETVTVDVTMVK